MRLSLVNAALMAAAAAMLLTAGVLATVGMNQTGGSAIAEIR